MLLIKFLGNIFPSSSSTIVNLAVGVAAVIDKSLVISNWTFLLQDFYSKYHTTEVLWFLWNVLWFPIEPTSIRFKEDVLLFWDFLLYAKRQYLNVHVVASHFRPEYLLLSRLLCTLVIMPTFSGLKSELFDLVWMFYWHVKEFSLIIFSPQYFSILIFFSELFWR